MPDGSSSKVGKSTRQKPAEEASTESEAISPENFHLALFGAQLAIKSIGFLVRQKGGEDEAAKFEKLANGLVIAGFSVVGLSMGILNPLAALTLFSGIGGFLGGGGGSDLLLHEISNQVKLLHREMSLRLDRIERQNIEILAQLEIISKKLDHLDANVTESFQAISSFLRVDKKLEVETSLLDAYRDATSQHWESAMNHYFHIGVDPHIIYHPALIGAEATEVTLDIELSKRDNLFNSVSLLSVVARRLGVADFYRLPHPVIWGKAVRGYIAALIASSESPPRELSHLKELESVGQSINPAFQALSSRASLDKAEQKYLAKAQQWTDTLERQLKSFDDLVWLSLRDLEVVKQFARRMPDQQSDSAYFKGRYELKDHKKTFMEVSKDDRKYGAFPYFYCSHRVSICFKNVEGNLMGVGAFDIFSMLQALGVLASNQTYNLQNYKGYDYYDQHKNHQRLELVFMPESSRFTVTLPATLTKSYDDKGMLLRHFVVDTTTIDWTMPIFPLLPKVSNFFDFLTELYLYALAQFDTKIRAALDAEDFSGVSNFLHGLFPVLAANPTLQKTTSELNTQSRIMDFVYSIYNSRALRIFHESSVSPVCRPAKERLADILDLDAAVLRRAITSDIELSRELLKIIFEEQGLSPGHFKKKLNEFLAKKIMRLKELPPELGLPIVDETQQLIELTQALADNPKEWHKVHNEIVAAVMSRPDVKQGLPAGEGETIPKANTRSASSSVMLLTGIAAIGGAAAGIAFFCLKPRGARQVIAGRVAASGAVTGAANAFRGVMSAGAEAAKALMYTK